MSAIRRSARVRASTRRAGDTNGPQRPMLPLRAGGRGNTSCSRQKGPAHSSWPFCIAWCSLGLIEEHRLVLGAWRADVVAAGNEHVECAVAVGLTRLGLIENVAAAPGLDRVRSRRATETADAAVDVDRRVGVLR